MYVRMHACQTVRQSLILFSFLHRTEKSNVVSRKTIPITIGSNSESQKSTMKRQTGDASATKRWETSNSDSNSILTSKAYKENDENNIQSV